MNLPAGMLDRLIGTQLSPQPNFLALVNEVETITESPSGLHLRIVFAWAVRRLPDGTYLDSDNFLGWSPAVSSISEIRVTDGGLAYILTGVENILYASDTVMFFAPDHLGFVGDGTNPSSR